MKETLALLWGKCCIIVVMILIMMIMMMMMEMEMMAQIIILAKIMIFNYLTQNRMVGGTRAQLHVLKLIKTMILLRYPTHNLSLDNKK